MSIFYPRTTTPQYEEDMGKYSQIRDQLSQYAYKARGMAGEELSDLFLDEIQTIRKDIKWIAGLKERVSKEMLPSDYSEVEGEARSIDIQMRDGLTAKAKEIAQAAKEEYKEYRRSSSQESLRRLLTQQKYYKRMQPLGLEVKIKGLESIDYLLSGPKRWKWLVKIAAAASIFALSNGVTSMITSYIVSPRPATAYAVQNGKNAQQASNDTGIEGKKRERIEQIERLSKLEIISKEKHEREVKSAKDETAKAESAHQATKDDYTRYLEELKKKLGDLERAYSPDE